MTDAWQYAVWPDPRSRSWVLENHSRVVDHQSRTGLIFCTFGCHQTLGFKFAVCFLALLLVVWIRCLSSAWAIASATYHLRCRSPVTWWCRSRTVSRRRRSSTKKCGRWSKPHTTTPSSCWRITKVTLKRFLNVSLADAVKLFQIQTTRILSGGQTDGFVFFLVAS